MRRHGRGEDPERSEGEDPRHYSGLLRGESIRLIGPWPPSP
jgi:hypothetical protein